MSVGPYAKHQNRAPKDSSCEKMCIYAYKLGGVKNYIQTPDGRIDELLFQE